MHQGQCDVYSDKPDIMMLMLNSWVSKSTKLVYPSKIVVTILFNSSINNLINSFQSGSEKLSFCTKLIGSFLNVSGMVLNEVSPSRSVRIWGSSCPAYSGQGNMFSSDGLFGSSVLTKRTRKSVRSVPPKRLRNSVVCAYGT